jgi:hypothetical protein
MQKASKIRASETLAEMIDINDGCIRSRTTLPSQPDRYLTPSMSEPTIAQTVLGSISLGAKLALTLYELAARVASVSTDIGRLARDITQFCSQLRQIEAVLKDEVNYSLSAEALSVLRKIAARSQECLEDLQQVADTVDSEASLHIPLKAESKDASRANSPNVFPNEKRRAWKPGSSNKNGGNPNGPEDGVKSQAEKVKFTLNRPRTLLVRQELDCLSIFLQLMVAICQSAQGSFRQGYEHFTGAQMGRADQTPAHP